MNFLKLIPHIQAQIFHTEKVSKYICFLLSPVRKKKKSKKKKKHIIQDVNKQQYQLSLKFRI